KKSTEEATEKHVDSGDKLLPFASDKIKKHKHKLCNRRKINEDDHYMPMENYRRDIISQLPDDLLLRILSSLSLKEVMATSFLSQRWRSLWKLGSKLKIGNKDFSELLVKWVSRSLAISNPQILKSLDIKLIPGELDRNINSLYRFSSLVKTAVSCGLRELKIEFLYTSLELPSIFYACGTLETLILCRLYFADVPPNGSLSSLKTLCLLSVKFSGDESVQKLLSICPVLEELVVRRSGYSNVEIFTINVPSLTSLSIDYIRVGSHQPAGVHGFVINAPSLRYLNIRDRHSNYLLFTNMPELVKANVEAVCDQSESLIGSLASVRHLSLCSKSSNIPYHAGTSFAFLEHLELCTCSSECWNLLSRIITDPLTLRVLKLKLLFLNVCYRISRIWNVNIQRLKAKQVAKYILANAAMENYRRDIISQLPDDLLLRILSSLSLKEVMATSFLSQRWRSLWKLGSKLKIGNKDFSELLVKWVSRSLAISNPQILKSLDIKLIPGELDRNINSLYRFSSLVKTAVSCGLRELKIEFLYTSLELPSIFYACGTLETLILCRLYFADVPPNGSLSSLKTLCLLSVKFSGDESVQKLLSICPVLEELVVRRSGYSNVEIFTINVPSLTSLSIDYIRVGSHQPAGVHGFVINAPSLRYLNIRDRHSNYLLFTNMPELVKANVEAVCDQSESLIGSLASVRYLSLCSKSSNIPYHAGTSFAFLEHLELCTCSSECCNLLSRIITDPLTLRVLKLKSIHRAH
ncbi:hypothetical protein IGI04_005779, partial [Brassica rapa subsp. trilocularis]